MLDFYDQSKTGLCSKAIYQPNNISSNISRFVGLGYSLHFRHLCLARLPEHGEYRLKLFPKTLELFYQTGSSLEMI